MIKPCPFIVPLFACVLLAGCSPADDAPPATETAAGVVMEELPALEPASEGAATFVVGPSGNEVRYRVREQLAGFDFPNDAIGKTTSVSGQIVIDDDGGVVSDASRFVVDAATLTSDRDRRDNYIRRRTLTVEQHPTIVLVPTEMRGLTIPAAGSGSDTFELVGNLTVRGVTRPTTWNATAQFRPGRVSGSASTRFVFTEFEMEKPRVRSVLSVADTIALEYDFSLVREDRARP
ncbi:MAG: YceI family protein [Gemmatimonadaceae bacterium]